MAAITFKFGVQSQITPLESRLANDDGALSGLGDAGTARLEEAVIAQTHASLWNMAYLRDACAKILKGRTIKVEYIKGEVWLVLNEALPQEPSWNPPTKEGLNRFKLLSWTSKMGTPSFSLPAGAPALGGSCPGAVGGQTLVPLKMREAQKRDVEAITKIRVDPAKAICQHCYAEGGQYSTGQVQYAQLMRFAWAIQAVQNGTFAQIMDWAVKNADYALDGSGKVSMTDENGEKISVPARGERDGRKYFRIHDSGDFFNTAYVAAWRQVADANPDVTFWAPSRIWALGRKVIETVNEINGPVKNLVIRPSAYSINERDLTTSPRGTRFADNPLKNLGPGWAAGTTVYGDAITPKDMNGDIIEPNIAFDWDCKAYQTDNDKVTCRDAVAPDGKVGCRACWRFGTQGTHDENGPRGLVVNYTLH